MTDVIDGPPGANAEALQKGEGESFSPMTVGSTEIGRAGWVVDELVSVDEQLTRAGSVSQTLTLPFRRPAWASRRVGSAASVRAAPALQAPAADYPAPSAAPRRLHPRQWPSRSAGHLLDAVDANEHGAGRRAATGTASR